jgi:hypothetical protein
MDSLEYDAFKMSLLLLAFFAVIAFIPSTRIATRGGSTDAHKLIGNYDEVHS